MAKAKTTKKTTKKATTSKKKDKEVKVDRRAPTKDRRKPDDRRQETVAVDDERRVGPERRKVSRRRQIDPTTCERDYNNDEIEFMHALDAYKRAAGRMFPTCSEILEVLRDLGYRRLKPEELAKLGINNDTGEGATASDESDTDSQTDPDAATDDLGVAADFSEESLEDFEG